MCDEYGEACFRKKDVYKLAKYEFRTLSLCRKDSPWNERLADSPVNKTFRAQRSVKKVILAVFWDMQGPTIIDFLEKDTTVNRTSIAKS